MALRQDCELLPPGEIFKEEISARPNRPNERYKQKPEHARHGSLLSQKRRPDWSGWDFGEAQQVLKTPVRTPQANAFWERLIGTIRRECLDFVIPLNDRHLRRMLREWVAHYN